MATGRTATKWVRVYMDAHSGLGSYSRAVGPLTWEFDETDATAMMGDSAKGYLPNQSMITPTTYNATLEGSGFFGTYFSPELPAATPYYSTIAVPIGIRAAPAEGDPVFCGQFLRKSLTSSEDGGLITQTMDFGPWVPHKMVAYNIPWGVLAHEYSQETAVNSATGIDQTAATSFGGYMLWNAVGANGTATIKMQDAATNTDGSFADVTGLTTGVVDWTTAAPHGIAVTAATATIRRYVRWQIVLGTATSVYFLLAFVRRYGVGQ